MPKLIVTTDQGEEVGEIEVSEDRTQMINRMPGDLGIPDLAKLWAVAATYEEHDRQVAAMRPVRIG